MPKLSRVRQRGTAGLTHLVACVLLLPVNASESADPIFDAKGFQPNREMVSQLPFEHIDPMTGNLLLTFTDLVLPGNAGFDLRIQRTYNSKIYAAYQFPGGWTLGEDSWAGLGWTLHLGRVLNPNDVNPGPVIEMPDGSRHQLYLHLDHNVDHFITKDYWTYDKVAGPQAPPILRLPNGVTYTFGHTGAGTLYATEIRDAFGNKAVITYANPPAPGDVIATVEQRLVGEPPRTITFGYNATLPGPGGPEASGSLATMTFLNRTWNYTQTLTKQFTYTLLTEVEPPVGPSWAFSYENTDLDSTFILTHVDTPNGGAIDYTYSPQIFYFGSGFLYSPAVTQRHTSGRDVAGGTWTYAYSTSPAKNQTDITSPCNITTTYTFLGIGPGANQDAWAIGAMDKRITAETNGPVFETDDLTWIASTPISNVAESGSSPQTHVALLSQRDVTVSSRTYSTSYTYSNLSYDPLRANNFNDFGRAHTISETGDLARSRFRTFFYGSQSDPSFGTYIVDKLKSETVQVGNESFTRSYAYDAATGFKKSDTIYGITTTYTPDALGSGNVGRSTDANNHSTTFEYNWGVADKIETPEFTITRVVNTDSTVQSEKRRTFTTQFFYDQLMRPTTTIPPAGNAIVTSYGLAGDFVKVSRGPSAVTTFLDGFGRNSATSNKVGVKTDVRYDACGRLEFESYPFTGATPTGTTYGHDPIGRIKLLTHANGDRIAYEYPDGVDVDVTDEENRLTRQDWSAFGHPTEDLRLTKLTDANDVETQYTFNALGSLKSVTLPGGQTPVRTWTYNLRNELIEEAHPESGSIVYTYDLAGNLKTRDDAAFETTTFTYDDNDRLTGVDRQGSAYDTLIAYDESDNRTLLTTAEVTSIFTYDAANRLVSRTDDIDGMILNTAHEYDGNDNLDLLTYPSGARVAYTYDDENRISLVTNGAGTPYANQFSYHPSGALFNYRAGNGLHHSFTYDPRYRLRSVNAGHPGSGTNSKLKLTYIYDKVSNIKRIEDSRGLLFSPELEHDNLDRVTTVENAFGTPSFDYDDGGNRRFKQIGAARTDYTYDPVTQRLTSAVGAEPAAFTYDPNGNVVGDGSATYGYAPTNMLASATIGTSTTKYLYDGDGLRKAKVGDGGIAYYVHDSGGKLLGEYRNNAGSPIVVRDYVMAGTRVIAEVLPTVLNVTPTSLTFLAILNRPPPPPKTVSLMSSGPVLGWTASDSAPWLGVSPPSGSTPATLTVTVNPARLSPGTYSASIILTATGAVNNPVVVPVELVVFATASLYLSPSSLSFARPANGPDPPSKSVHVLFPGEPVQWSADPVEDWISVQPPNGSTPGTLNVFISGSGLPPGSHQGRVIVTANGVPGSPQTLAVELVIGPAAGQTCAAEASYCEILDDEPPGDLAAGWIWSEPDVPQVVRDPRQGGSGNVMLLDPPEGERLNGDVDLSMPHAISGTEISIQLMTAGTNPSIPLSLAKVEFYTKPGRAWGKTTRTFGTLRFGSTLRFQYGPTDYELLVNPMQPGRWYAVRVRYEGGQSQVFVDGVLKFTTAAPDADLQLEAFSLTAWDFAPGDAYVDVLQAKPGELFVQPLDFELEASSHPQCDPGIATRGSSSSVASVLKAAAMHSAVAFEPNRGQADPSVQFIARARSHLLLVRSRDLVLALPEKRQGVTRDSMDGRLFGRPTRRSADPPRVALVHMKLGLPQQHFEFQPEDRIPGFSHYLIGNNPDRWHRRIHRYGRLVAKGIYPGVDLVLRDNEGTVEYDLLVAPGADISQIEVAFEGVSGLTIDAVGDVVMTTSLGRDLRQPRPVMYQEIGGVRRRVAGRYIQRSAHSVGFQVGGYDPTKPLVIDPVLAWTTQLGGPDMDEPHDLAHDAAGNVYVTGPAISPDLGTWLVFVTKLAANGGAVIYSTLLGGDHGGEGQGIAVDASGSAIVTGPTSAGFPQVPPSSPPYGPGGLDDAFVVKLSADGSQILFATTLGGTQFEDSHGVAVDDSGRIYLAGVTVSPDFPTQAPHQPNRAGIRDSFFASLSSDGQQLRYSTYFGGNEVGAEYATKVSVTGTGEAYFTGITTSGDFPGAGGCGEEGDAFVVRLSPVGGLLGSRCLGGSAEDVGNDVNLTPGGGGPVIGGATSSPDFPVEQPLGSYAGGLYDAFVAEFSADLSQVLFSSPFGGSQDDEGGGVVTNAASEIYLTGVTTSPDLPVLSPLSCGQELSANTFVAKLSANRQLVYATLMPAVAEPGLTGIWQALSLAPGGVYVSWMAQEDGFVARVLDATVPGTVHLAPLATAECEGDPIRMRVERSGGVAGMLIVDYDPRDGTATAPSDYNGTPGSVTLGDAVCSVPFSISTVWDGGGEPDETFSVELTNVTGPATIGQPSILGAAILGDGRVSAQFSVSQRSQPTGPNWQATVDVPWLTLDFSSGIGPSLVTVTADPSGLPNGTHVGHIKVTANVAGSPQEILVTLKATN